MSDLIEELYRSQTSAVGRCQNILFICGGGAPTHRDLDATRQQSQALVERAPAGVAVLLCISPTGRPPEQHMRQQVIDQLKSLAPHTIAFAWVVLGEGFIAAAVRSVISAITFGARSSFPNKVFSDMDSAVRWLVLRAGKSGGALDPAALAVEAKAMAGLPFSSTGK